MAPEKNVICLVVDRLHSGMIGPYGNSWIHTRQLDRLACESFVFDQAFVDDPRLDAVYRGYWFGESARADSQPDPGASLARRIGDAGWHTAIVSDEPEALQWAGARDFAERVAVAPPPFKCPAASAAHTHIARVVGAAVQWLEARRSPFFLWIHVRGLAALWDAPWEFRDRYAEQEDPQPPRFCDVPNRWLAESYDPDELLGIVQAYAGQVSLLDDWLAPLSDWLAGGGPADSTLFALISARGFPLGEHLRVGQCDGALYNELVQVPWFMRFPDGLGRLARSQALVRPADLPGTLLDWLGIARRGLGSEGASSLLDIIRGDADALRDAVRMVSANERAIRTPAWFLRQTADGAAELYAKPGDRWEVNEVSKLLGDIVSGLQLALSQSPPPGGPEAALDLALVSEVD